MFSFKCDKCNKGWFILNVVLTSEKLAMALSLLINEDGTLNMEDVTDEVVMTCQFCHATTVSTFEELVAALKISIVTGVVQSRQRKAYMKLNSGEIKEEAGISYCGLCMGPFEEDGYCYNDIKSQCIVRKAYNKKHKNDK